MKQLLHQDLTCLNSSSTAGPVYREWDKEQNEELLVAAYTNSLRRAVENKCESIAFPLISSGIYGYPKDEGASRVAISAIQDFLMDHDLDVMLLWFLINQHLY